MIFLTNPLHFALHHGLRWQLATQFPFAAGLPCVPAVAAELKDLARHVPLVLQKQADGFRVVVPTKTEWLKRPLISAEGQWLWGLAPVMLRYHPFTILKDGTGSGEPILAVVADPRWLDAESGEPFFDEHQRPLPPVQAIHRHLRHLEAQNEKLSAAMRALDALRLISPAELTDARGRRPFHTIQVSALAELSGEQWARLDAHHQLIAHVATALDLSQALHLPDQLAAAPTRAPHAPAPALQLPAIKAPPNFLVDDDVIMRF